jgi:hypothetical protein
LVNRKLLHEISTDPWSGLVPRVWMFRAILILVWSCKMSLVLLIKESSEDINVVFDSPVSGKNSNSCDTSDISCSFHVYHYCKFLARFSYSTKACLLSWSQSTLSSLLPLAALFSMSLKSCAFLKQVNHSQGFGYHLITSKSTCSN